MKFIAKIFTAIFLMAAFTPFYILGLLIGAFIRTTSTGYKDGVEASINNLANAAKWLKE